MPVEERIDHARERLTAWLDDVQLSNHLGCPVYANPSELKADLRALLTEHSAREESWRLVERYVDHYPDDWRILLGRGDHFVELSVTEEQWRIFDSLLATESAQPEEERRG